MLNRRQFFAAVAGMAVGSKSVAAESFGWSRMGDRQLMTIDQWAKIHSENQVSFITIRKPTAKLCSTSPVPRETVIP